ncbi:MAG: oligoendopeptidase F [Rickettsiales bacterium]|nr:oligoendopeptidase F [Rickettsiales bacterium]
MAKAAAKETLPHWDLDDLYPGVESEKLAKDVKKAERLCSKFAKYYQGKVAKLSAKNLAAAISDYEKIQDLLGRLGSYAQLLYAADMSDPKIAQFYQNTHETLNRLSTQVLFFTLSINKISDKDMKKMLKVDELAHYGPWLRDVRTYRTFQLSDELEQLLHEKDVTEQAWVRLYDETQAGLRFPMGNKKLTITEVLNLLSSKDAKQRKDAALVLSKVLNENISLFSLVTNTLAKNKEIEDNWRGFAKPIASRNVANQVEDEVVDALLATVQANYESISHRYYKWKAKQFNKRKLDWWDRNAPLPKSAESNYGWNESVELVMSAYTAFSPTLAKHGRKFFDNNWIDVPPREGKDSGAFAHPTVPSAHPYLLLNFQGKTRDVMTLAHELGHGVHQVLSAKQGALMADTPLTLAETASVFGEMLTFKELLRREQNEEKRQYLIASKVEDMINTVVRQTAFCLFETKVHAERRSGEVSAERLGEIWMQVQRESLGPALKFDDKYSSYWAYIPHFIHSPFYVYAYAFGDCLVNSLYAVYEQEAEKGAKQAKAFEKKYIDMLKAGGTLRHKELLKPFGLNAAKADFWQQGLNVISGYIDQLD